MTYSTNVNQEIVISNNEGSVFKFINEHADKNEQEQLIRVLTCFNQNLKEIESICDKSSCYDYEKIECIKSKFKLLFDSINEVPDLFNFVIEKIDSTCKVLKECNQLQLVNYFLNEQQRFEIAKNAVEKNIEDTLQNVKDYNLSEQQRFELCKIVADKNPETAAEIIPQFDLHEQHELEIVTFIVEKGFGGDVSNIVQFYRSDEQRFEIVKILARNNEKSIPFNIDTYGLKQRQRFEIAKLIASQDGMEISSSIENYHLKDPMMRFQIFLIASRQNPELIAHFSDYRFSREELRGNPLLEAFYFLFEGRLNILNIFKEIQQFANVRGWEIKSIVEKILNLSNAEQQKESIMWMTELLVTYSLENFSKEEFNSSQFGGFMESVFSLRDPALRYELIITMLQYAKNPIAEKFAASYQDIAPHQQLPLFAISLLHAQGVPKTTCDQLLEISKNKHFKDQRLLRQWLKGINQILQEPGLTPAEKTNLLSTLMDQSKELVPGKGETKREQISIPLLLQNLNIIATCILFKEVRYLKDNGDLSSTLQDVFIRHLPIKYFHDFADRYQRHFANARIPHYITTYIAKIEQDPNAKKDLNDALVRCVEAILEDNFKNLRYDMEKSLHLKTVFSGRKNLFEEWKKGASYSFHAFLSDISGQEKDKLQKYENWTIVDSDDVQDLFLCGTDVGSCQTITGEAAKNKCLMGYVLDGKNRLLAVKDPSGKIRARQIFRILWDGKQPVLFLEMLYPEVVPPELQAALLKLAKQRADAMGLPLLISSKNKYERPVQSLGSMAPFEYCDGDSLGVTDGCYEILFASRLH